MSETSRLSAAAVLAQFPGPVTLRPNNRDYVRHLIIMLLATAVGAWGLWHYAQVENLPYMLMNVPILVVGATCSVVIAQALMNGFMRLTLDSEGFESHDTWRLRRRRWRDASDFKPTTLLNNPVVAYQYAYLPTGFWRRFFLGGGNARLFDTYGLTPDDLAYLMNEWRRRALLIAPPLAAPA